ncbi:hypothetical protein LLG96_03205 [bacterium]|nr:hypothetical protein [bacterium]
MNRFTALLREMSGRLDVPQPLKSRILLELAGDLEDLYATYINRGIAEETAMRMAVDKIAIGDEAVDLLIRLNDSAVKRFLRRFPSHVQRWIEVISWCVIMLAASCVLYMKASHGSLFIDGPFAWMLAGITLALCGITISRLYVLYIKRDHTVTRIRSGLPFMLFLGCLSILIGVDGFFLEIYSALIKAIYAGGKDVSGLISTLQGAFFFVALSFFLAATASVIWFVFTLKTLTIEQHEKAVLYGKPLS